MDSSVASICNSLCSPMSIVFKTGHQIFMRENFWNFNPCKNFSFFRFLMLVYFLLPSSPPSYSTRMLLILVAWLVSYSLTLLFTMLGTTEFLSILSVLIHVYILDLHIIIATLSTGAWDENEDDRK